MSREAETTALTEITVVVLFCGSLCVFAFHTQSNQITLFNKSSFELPRVVTRDFDVSGLTKRDLKEGESLESIGGLSYHHVRFSIDATAKQQKAICPVRRFLSRQVVAFTNCFLKRQILGVVRESDWASVLISNPDALVGKIFPIGHLSIPKMWLAALFLCAWKQVARSARAGGLPSYPL